MYRVFKFPVPVQDAFTLDMPENAQVLTVQVQHEQAVLWALVDDSVPYTTRHFAVHGTGHIVPSVYQHAKYIGTFQLMLGRFVGHLFEMPSGTTKSDG